MDGIDILEDTKQRFTFVSDESSIVTSRSTCSDFTVMINDDTVNEALVQYFIVNITLLPESEYQGAITLSRDFSIVQIIDDDRKF